MEVTPDRGLTRACCEAAFALTEIPRRRDEDHRITTLFPRTSSLYLREKITLHWFQLHAVFASSGNEVVRKQVYPTIPFGQSAPIHWPTDLRFPSSFRNSAAFATKGAVTSEGERLADLASLSNGVD